MQTPPASGHRNRPAFCGCCGQPATSPEARRMIGAGSAIVTTGGGIGLRSGGFGPRSSPAPSRSRAYAPLGMGRARCVGPERSQAV